MEDVKLKCKIENEEEKFKILSYNFKLYTFSFALLSCNLLLKKEGINGK